VRPTLHVLIGWGVSIRIGNSLEGDGTVFERVRINLLITRCTKRMLIRWCWLIARIRRSGHHLAEGIHHCLVI